MRADCTSVIPWVNRNFTISSLSFSQARKRGVFTPLQALTSAPFLIKQSAPFRSPSAHADSNIDCFRSRSQPRYQMHSPAKYTNSGSSSNSSSMEKSLSCAPLFTNISLFPVSIWAMTNMATQPSTCTFLSFEKLYMASMMADTAIWHWSSDNNGANTWIRIQPFCCIGTSAPCLLIALIMVSTPLWSELFETSSSGISCAAESTPRGKKRNP